jgi:hypothetical protein
VCGVGTRITTLYPNVHTTKDDVKLFEELKMTLAAVGFAISFFVLLSSDALLTVSAFEVVHMKTQTLLPRITRQCDGLTGDNGLSAAGTEETELIIIIFFTERIAIFRWVKLTINFLLAYVTYKMVGVIGFVQSVDHLASYGFLAHCASRTESLFPVFRTVGVAVVALPHRRAV